MITIYQLVSLKEILYFIAVDCDNTANCGKLNIMKRNEQLLFNTNNIIIIIVHDIL